MGRYGYDLGLHQFFHCQIFGCDDPEQTAVFQNIASVDRLLVYPGLLDMCQCFPHRRMLPKIDIFCCHNTSGAVLRIIQQLVDTVALLIVHIFQDPCDKVCREVFQ